MNIQRTPSHHVVRSKNYYMLSSVTKRYNIILQYSVTSIDLCYLTGTKQVLSIVTFRYLMLPSVAWLHIVLPKFCVCVQNKIFMWEVKTILILDEILDLRFSKKIVSVIPLYCIYFTEYLPPWGDTGDTDVKWNKKVKSIKGITFIFINKLLFPPIEIDTSLTGESFFTQNEIKE